MISTSRKDQRRELKRALKDSIKERIIEKHFTDQKLSIDHFKGANFDIDEDERIIDVALQQLAKSEH